MVLVQRKALETVLANPNVEHREPRFANAPTTFRTRMSAKLKPRSQRKALSRTK